ncbi:9557_t:CDS:2 [Rhizophagus irregularis]|nr:9557_t:CDS:2 [Rhizophagus irregularis]
MFSWSNSLNGDPADLDKLKKVTIVNTLAIHQSLDYKIRGEDNCKTL